MEAEQESEEDCPEESRTDLQNGGLCQSRAVSRRPLLQAGGASLTAVP